MHPAYSVIFFTTASGAGYGLLMLLIALAMAGVLPPDLWLGLLGFGIAFALVTFGLLSSMLHLGRPERAWRAFSQWRTSWLSREGVLSTITYAPAGLFAIGWVFFGAVSGAWAVAGVAAIGLTIATLVCTGMIYASLKPIRQWRHPLVVPVYLLLSLATGRVLLLFLLGFLGYPVETAGWLALASLAAGLAGKLAYLRTIDHAPRNWAPEAATGLGKYGKVRPLEPPHSQANFVMREMGYHVARKHARKLRRLTMLLGFAVPAAATALILATGLAAPLWALLAVVSAAAGVFIERWLFFAEAQHVVTLYYGAQAA
jgi:DMSO reductase anchor subunit